jgi:putative endonuclease
VERLYYVYIMTNLGHNVLYTGVTNDLARRVYEHRWGLAEGFTNKYQVHKLVYFEAHVDVHEALAREKKIKGGSRGKKIALIEGMNGYWLDLSEKLRLEED